MQIITDKLQKELKKHGSDEFPFLLSFEKLSKYESGSFMWHWHPEIEITYIQKGVMQYKINHNSFCLKEGEILFGNSNVLHSGCMDNSRDCEYISITFDPKLIYGFQKSIVYQKYVEPVIYDFSIPFIVFTSADTDYKFVFEAINNIVRLNEKKTVYFEIDIASELQKIWKSVFAKFQVSEECNSHEKRDYERVKNVLDYIEKNYMNKIYLENIASHIHLCPGECSRLFKRCMNMQLFGFLNEYRVERSLEYISDSSFTVTEIAGKCGFSDSNYYSKVFTGIKGCSPNKYRKNLKNKNNLT